jgi:hypothetical protein
MPPACVVLCVWLAVQPAANEMDVVQAIDIAYFFKGFVVVFQCSIAASPRKFEKIYGDGSYRRATHCKVK